MWEGWCECVVCLDVWGLRREQVRLERAVRRAERRGLREGRQAAVMPIVISMLVGLISFGDSVSGNGIENKLGVYNIDEKCARIKR